MSLEILENLDIALVRSLKQSFVAHNVIPKQFTFSTEGGDTFEVNCYPTMTIRFVPRASVSGSTPA